MAENAREFLYSQFDPATEIRVFEIELDKDDNIAYKLQNVNFEAVLGKYHALSYCWGTERASVNVNGHCIEIPQNLLDFSHTLWDAYGPTCESDLMFWADAICIDQDSNEEKAVHVKQMRYIYEEAQDVLAWLGPETDATHLARDLVDKILTFHDARAKEIGELAAWRNIDVRCEGLLNYRKGDPVLIDRSEAADGLYEFLSHSWWSRAWIMQEGTTQGPTVLFWGKTLLDRKDMYNIACYAKEIFEELNYQWAKGHGLPERYEHILMRRMLSNIFDTYIFDRTRNLALEKALPTSALSVLEAFRKKEASDVRDKVYAPLCLLSRASFKEFNVDYELSVEEVYKDVARRLINATSPPNLDVLGLCVPHEAGDSTMTLSLPSWVPDYTVWARRTQFCKALAPGSGPTYFADRPIRNLITFERNFVRFSDDFLHVKGVFVDEVATISPWNSIRHEFKMTYDWLPVDHKDGTYLTDEPMDLVYRRTLVADIEWFNDGSTNIRRRGGQLDWALLDGQVEDSRYFTMTTILAETGTERRLLLTEKGYFGIGPNSLQCGDQLYILLGGQVVYALRKNTEHYHLVGECYIHGLMDGEYNAIQPHQIQDITLA